MAVELTPYDPSAYNLLALAQIDYNFLDEALLDLQKALSLDQKNGRTVDLIKVFYQAYRQRKFPSWSYYPEIERQFNELIRDIKNN